MKTRGAFPLVLSRSFAPNGQPLGLKVSEAVLVLLLCGCAAQKDIGVKEDGVARVPGPVWVEPGPIAVACAPEPARVSFDKAVGKAAYASDGAADLARGCLVLPTPPEPGLDALYSPIGLVLAPFGAGYGALTSSRRMLSAGQLSESEANLERIMAVMADQKQLRDPLLETAGERSRRRFVPVDSLFEEQQLEGKPVSAVLETRVEELRLERTGSKADSFALRIKARVLLHRASDGQVLYEQELEYTSEAALFLDWTSPQAFRGVAETGYRELAKHIAERLLSTAEGPLLVGAGYQRSPRPASTAPGLMVAMNQRDSEPDLVRATSSESGSGTLRIYSAERFAPVRIQQPLTKNEAVSEAISETGWSLDELPQSRNLGVQLSACVAAVPISLWKQAVGAVRGVRAETFAVADQRLSEASRQAQPQLELSQQVAMNLPPRTSQPVVLVKHTSAAGAVSAPVAGDDRATLLEIQVRTAALHGNGGVNPSLALCVEAQATLVRARDGAELYSCTVHYRGEKRKFTQWAADDARLFRAELQRCYHDVGNRIVDQLVARKLIAPNGAPQATLANR